MKGSPSRCCTRMSSPVCRSTGNVWLTIYLPPIKSFAGDEIDRLTIPSTHSAGNILEKLGILINSTAHNHAVVQLARAARERGKVVEIFLAAQGVRILGHTLFSQLAGIGRVWVCSTSIEALETDFPVPVPKTCRLVPPEELAEFLRTCDRHVVF